MESERAERLPLLADKSVLGKILEAKTPIAAVDIISGFPCDVALSVIDNLDELTAAFVVAMFRLNALRDDLYALELVPQIEAQKVRGSRGLVYARDKVYRETGYFAGA